MRTQRSCGMFLSCLFSFVITAALLFLMRHLVMTTDAAYEEGPPARQLVFARTVKDPEPPPRRPPPEKPKPPDEPPRIDIDVQFDADGAPPTIGAVAPVRPEARLVVGQGRMAIPILTPAPEYPQRALARGIEGWVLVSFTISETGAVVEPKVVDAEPRGVFDAAALRAVLRYRYRPQLVSGVATATPGMLLRIHFELEN